jgi:hypothetical protein
MKKVHISMVLGGLIFCTVLHAMAHANPTLEGCSIFPSNNIWNIPIDNLPVHSNSFIYIDTIGADTGLHPDFGSGEWNGGPIGIPYTVVSETQTMVEVSFDYAEESDPGPYPIPPDALIEGGNDSQGDRHVLVLEKDKCLLYELFDAHLQPDNSWHAGSGAFFDLSSNNLRPDTWTSADAAGLPILAGLVRYDEVTSGEITHAIRFTAPQTQKAHVWPARHHASSLTGLVYPPMGQRFRLKADYDISGFPLEIQTILTAFKKYGIILADNGSAWYISGVPDGRWDNDALRLLRQIKGSDFEAVDVSSLMIDEDSGEAKQSPENSMLYVGADNCEGKTPCFDSIQTAINTAVGDTQIMIAKGTYSESVRLNKPISVTLEGGWNFLANIQDGVTIFRKAPEVNLGSLTFRELTIKP